MKRCYACDTQESKGWYFNRGTNLMLCRNCHDVLFRKSYFLEYGKNYYFKNKDRFLERKTNYMKKYYIKNKDRIINRERKRIRFKGKPVVLKYNPRIGVCNWCRAVVPFDCKSTHMHHDENKYYELEPSKNTIELCVSCHRKETNRLFFIGPM